MHNNSKSPADFSRAAQAHCKISVKLLTIVSNVPQYLEGAEKRLNSSVSSKAANMLLSSLLPPHTLKNTHKKEEI